MRCHWGCVVSVMLSLAVYAPGAPAFAQDKLPIPPAEAQRDALALIKEVYGQEWEAAKTPEQKTALAQKLLDKSREAADDATRFALIRVGRVLAVQGGDVSVAFRAIDVTSYRFQIDTFAAKVQTLLEAAKSASVPDHQKAVATEARKLIEQAVQEDDFETVKRLYEAAAATARSANEWDLARKIVARNREIEEVAAAYAAIDDAVTLLKLDPVDPEANLAVGKYHCFVKGNWDRGLPMLALGNDEKLKELSVKELREVSDTDGQVALGDGWWDLAATSEGVAQKQLQERAALWYRRALPRLSGLVRDRVNARLAASPHDSTAGTTTPATNDAPGIGNGHGWFVIFRSADPRIWNTDTNRGENDFAIRISRVPDDIRYLRMRMFNTTPICIRISKEHLTDKGYPGTTYLWNGSKFHLGNSHALGIASRTWAVTHGQEVQLLAWPQKGTTDGWFRGRGWGFGHKLYSGGNQGYTWAGREIGRTVFEIAVKSGPLTFSETQMLLR